jgi:hypothetical protein
MRTRLVALAPEEANGPTTSASLASLAAAAAAGATYQSSSPPRRSIPLETPTVTTLPATTKAPTIATATGAALCESGDVPMLHEPSSTFNRALDWSLERY